MLVLHFGFCLFVLGCTMRDLRSLTGDGTGASFFGSEESPSLDCQGSPGCWVSNKLLMSVLQVCGPQFEQRRYKAHTQGLYLRRGGMEFWIWRPRGSIISIPFTLHHLHAPLNPLVSQEFTHTLLGSLSPNTLSPDPPFLWVPHPQHLQPLHPAQAPLHINSSTLCPSSGQSHASPPF